jgi:CheY-like chemotaxis protein
MALRLLIVENEKNVADVHADAFAASVDYPCEHVHAESPEQATELMLSSPSFDGVVCDLSFDDADGVANSHGAQVGRWMRERDYPAVTFLSTAKFKEKDGEFKRARALFDDVIPPGAEVPVYRDAAEKARLNKLNRLEQSRLMIDPAIAQKNENALKKIHTLIDPSIDSSQRAYFEQGFEIAAAQPVVKGFAVGSPIFVWVKKLGSGFYLEVYGQPRLLAYGETFELGLRTLNDVLYRTYLEVDGKDDLAGPMLYIKRFLEAVYDDNFHAVV